MEQANAGINLLQVAEIELVYKSKVKPSQRPQVKKSREIFELFLRYWDENKIEYIEEFKVMYLNRAQRVLGIYTVSSGSERGTIGDPRQVFTAALKANAALIVLCHNHPSEKLSPSIPDKELTVRMKECGRLLEVTVLDHLIHKV
jgi:DNA repair protein RadC